MRSTNNTQYCLTQMAPTNNGIPNSTPRADDPLLTGTLSSQMMAICTMSAELLVDSFNESQLPHAQHIHVATDMLKNVANHMVPPLKQLSWTEPTCALHTFLTCICSHTHTYTYTNTHTDTDTHTHTHTQTHKHKAPTNLLVPAPPSSSSQVTACWENHLLQWQL